MIALLFLAAIPVVLWVGLELDARKHGAREAARRKRARKGYIEW